MTEFDPTAQGIAGDTFTLLPDGQPFPDAGEYDIWLSQVTADYSALGGLGFLVPSTTLVPHTGLVPAPGP